MTATLHIEKLQRTHAVDAFTCGQPELDRFLIRHALQAQQMNSSQTYVGVSDKTVVGFYTIVAGEVRHADAPERVVKGMPRHPIPLLILARLAVHSERQGRRIGAGLLLGMSWDAHCRLPIFSEYARLASMQKTILPQRFIGASDLYRQSPIAGTCLESASNYWIRHIYLIFH